MPSSPSNRVNETRSPVAATAAAGLLLATCAPAPPAAPPGRSAEVRAYCGPRTDEVEHRVAALLPQLTLEQKATLMRGEALTAGGTWEAPGWESLGIPPLTMIDGPRGVHKAARAATAFPVGMARGATFDPALEERVGAAIGEEARAAGAGVILAPTMNLLRHPRWGRAQETYGEDPFHIGAMALAFVRGAQRHVMATAKHFAVNSIEDTRLTVDVTLDERTLRETYLPHFRRVVMEGPVATVMTAYNQVNGSYCSQNQHLVREILKGEWRFAGFVMSDWVWGTHDTAAAARAGLDLEMPWSKIYGDPLVEAVAAGQVAAADVDEAVGRLLRARYCYRLDTDPPVPDPGRRETPEHRALAREVAERSLVLLANRDGALPLDRATLGRVVVTGKLADAENLGDNGSSAVQPSTVTTVLEGLRAEAGAVEIAHLPRPPAGAGDEALLAAADAVVIVAGLTADDEGEAQVAAGDRRSLALPPDQVAWIRAVAAHSSRVILVLEGSGALEVGDLLPEVEAVLFAWYPGMEGGSAIARVLFGEVSPSGRLPHAFPAREADLPPFDNTSPRVEYGPLHGYRHLDAQGTAPLFPFGFGLSYTTFTLAALTLERSTLAPSEVLRATVEVTNTGPRPGRETVQLYLGALRPEVPHAVRELRGFAQVDLLPGEKRTVAIEVPVSELAHWDAASRAYRVAPGPWRVEAGTSSRDLPLQQEITITESGR